MVIRGNARGNAKQLAHYLLEIKENEDIRILNVDGQPDASAEALHRAIFAMGISAELTKGEKGLYHAQINPAPGEDKMMNEASWLYARDILAKQLGLENQRSAIVLHTKKGRTHAHVVWERYDHDKGRFISDSFSRLAQDRARKEMEHTFNHTKTPHRNKHRPELKASLLAIWHQTGTGAQFVKAARENNYIIAKGSGRSPFIVVDEFGRSYDLARQLKGITLKDVRNRLRNEHLIGEKDAITLARKAFAENNSDINSKDKSTQSRQEDFAVDAEAFKEAKDSIFETPEPPPVIPVPEKEKPYQTAARFKATKDGIIDLGTTSKETPEKEDIPKQKKAQPKAETKKQQPEKEAPIDPRREAFRKEWKEMEKQQRREREMGGDMDFDF